MSQLRTIGIIGYGAIADAMIDALERRDAMEALKAVLVRPARLAAAREKAAGRFTVVDSLEDLLQLDPGIVVEAAGHGAVHEFGPRLLAQGFDFLVSSVGALADRQLSRQLTSAAAKGSELWIAGGAVAGIDGLLAARTCGLHSVTYASTKFPLSWKGTAAEPTLAKSGMERRIVFFRGTAREAATQYPQNANVGATIALASLGLDHTTVELISDPDITGPLGVITAEGEFGRFTFECLALASQTNPKTSAITGHSLAAAALDGMAFRALDRLRAAG
jgi:aspartate dehydrogenase